MTVQTTTQDIIDQVNEHIEGASKLLAKLIAEEPWGWDEISKEYRKEIFDVLLSLGELRGKL